MTTVQETLIDAHMHVGLIGDGTPSLGGMSEWYRQQLVFKIFMLYLRIRPEQLSDGAMRRKTVETIASSGIPRAVCLALDPVYDQSGNERKDLSHVWVSNEYILELRKDLPDRVLFGASVHPYDPRFKERVKACVDRGAVLLKWLPSAQQINLADKMAADALRFLATARDGRPLPLLLHVGVEYAIPTSDPRKASYDFLSWSVKDKILNFLRFTRKWHTPDVSAINRNIREALDEGGDIIFAHCGLPYFAPGFIRGWLEHDDFDVVRGYLERSHRREFKGRCFADVSAFCTPFRKGYFRDVGKLPPETLLFGSDFPTPAFELDAGLEEHMEDFRAVMHGQLDRILIPEDDLLDVNYRVLRHFFPGHPLFRNFHDQLL